MDIRSEVAACKTRRELYRVFALHNLHIVEDESEEMGYFSVWLDSRTRVYSPRRGEYRYQTFTPVKMQYSGIPVFFADKEDVFNG